MLVASALCLPAPAPSTRLHDPWAPLSLPFASVTAAALLWTAMRELRAAAAAAAADAGQDAATGEGAQSGDAGADSECDVSVADAGALQRVLTDLAVPLGVATTTTAAISEATVSRVVRRCCGRRNAAAWSPMFLSGASLRRRQWRRLLCAMWPLRPCGAPSWGCLTRLAAATPPPTPPPPSRSSSS